MFVVDVMNDDGVIVSSARRLAGQVEVVGERGFVEPNDIVGPLRDGDECGALGVGDACADLVALGVDHRDGDADHRLVVGAAARVTLLVEDPDLNREFRVLRVSWRAGEGEESSRHREQRDDHTFQLSSCQLALPLPGGTPDARTWRVIPLGQTVERQAWLLTRTGDGSRRG